jgi:5'-3' exonuclease
MKLIVVNRSKADTFQRLSEKFADDINVRVVWDRRQKQSRQRRDTRQPDRRRGDRRRLKKDFDGRDYLVIHVVEDRSRTLVFP